MRTYLIDGTKTNLKYIYLLVRRRRFKFKFIIFLHYATPKYGCQN